jgi:hypothetical protein
MELDKRKFYKGTFTLHSEVVGSKSQVKVLSIAFLFRNVVHF